MLWGAQTNIPNVLEEKAWVSGTGFSEAWVHEPKTSRMARFHPNFLQFVWTDPLTPHPLCGSIETFTIFIRYLNAAQYRPWSQQLRKRSHHRVHLVAFSGPRDHHCIGRWRLLRCPCIVEVPRFCFYEHFKTWPLPFRRIIQYEIYKTDMVGTL